MSSLSNLIGCTVCLEGLLQMLSCVVGKLYGMYTHILPTTMEVCLTQQVPPVIKVGVYPLPTIMEVCVLLNTYLGSHATRSHCDKG